MSSNSKQNLEEKNKPIPEIMYVGISNDGGFSVLRHGTVKLEIDPVLAGEINEGDELYWEIPK